jgi:PAS domain S-box-containing protein
MDPLTIIFHEDRKEATRRIRMLEESKAGLNELQVWILRKDGQQRFVSARISAVQHAEIRYVFVILTDITELKAKEEAVKLSEQRFRMMAENVHDGIIIVENGNVVFANHRIADITGYSDKELTKLKSADLVSQKDRDKIEEIVNNTRPGSEKPGELIILVKRKDGSRRSILGRVTSADFNNTVTTYITMTDITDSTESEKGLLDRISALRN